MFQIDKYVPSDFMDLLTVVQKTREKILTITSRKLKIIFIALVLLTSLIYVL